jgi:hypothetical protein
VPQCFGNKRACTPVLLYWHASARCGQPGLSSQSASFSIYNFPLSRLSVPFSILQFHFRVLSISVCLGIFRAAPQELSFMFATADFRRTRLIYLRRAFETATVLSTLKTGNVVAEDCDVLGSGRPFPGQPLVWGKFGSWVGVSTCISRSLVCWQCHPLGVTDIASSPPDCRPATKMQHCCSPRGYRKLTNLVKKNIESREMLLHAALFAQVSQQVTSPGLVPGAAGSSIGGRSSQSLGVSKRAARTRPVRESLA